jgi:formylglycine-generating enzyme required for sulfatase activity
VLEKAYALYVVKPNAFGLYDIHDNMREWCMDHFGFDYYRQSPAIDPPGPPSGNPVCRGGAFRHRNAHLRSAFRHMEKASHRSLDQGIRVVLMR